MIASGLESAAERAMLDKLIRFELIESFNTDVSMVSSKWELKLIRKTVSSRSKSNLSARTEATFSRKSWLRFIDIINFSDVKFVLERKVSRSLILLVQELVLYVGKETKICLVFSVKSPVTKLIKNQNLDNLIGCTLQFHVLSCYDTRSNDS